MGLIPDSCRSVSRSPRRTEKGPNRPRRASTALSNSSCFWMAATSGSRESCSFSLKERRQARTLKERTGAPVIKAVRMETPGDAARWRDSAADWLLLDNGAGGTGRAFDWTLAAGVSKPFFLAGGIHPGNAADAVRRLRPYAVDASSGVETNGYKDGEKMRALVRAVREASGAAPGGLTE